MSFSVTLMKQMETVEPQLKTVLWTILEEIEQHREAAVTKSEFMELRDLVKELAVAQKSLGQKVELLIEAQTGTQKSLFEMQQVIIEMQHAQTEMQKSLIEIKQEQIKMQKEIAELTRHSRITRQQIGGLARSVSYALENEAYRALPLYLQDNYGIRIEKRFIRTSIGELEINLFAHAQKDDKEVLVVGESVLRLDDISKLLQVREQIKALKECHELPIIPVIITHFAHPGIQHQAESEGILVIQSFEW